MSEEIKHECGVALLRLRRNLNYYSKKYGSVYYGFEKLSLLLEKQHNRGQDGAGIACVGLDVNPGPSFLRRREILRATFASEPSRIDRRTHY